jgi:hypothetical protein
LPAPLSEPTEFVKWRINSVDLATLRSTYGPQQVNAAVRALIASYCARLRKEANINITQM